MMLSNKRVGSAFADEHSPIGASIAVTEVWQESPTIVFGLVG